MSGPPVLSSSCTGRFVADDGRRIVDLLGRRGPLLSRDIPDTCAVPWRGTSRNVTQMLKVLAMRGEVAISGRRGRQRVYPADTVVVPQDDPPVPRP